MFLTFRSVAATASRQCRQRALAVQQASVSHTRTLATSSTALNATVIKPVWFKRPTVHGSQTIWQHLRSVAQTAIEQTGKVQTPEDVWRSREKNEIPHLPRPNDAYSGRSVPVTNNQVSIALTKLKGILTINAVRQTSVQDERHEKKGEKRNRLRSLRWRRRFAHEVRKKVQLVNEIRARGA
ncbi:hypothetical protein GY45DRAFT_1238766 [Cubamyces sp. BRFM 1775]|nr:hypothetical protein GY45DRAFT_1238766 [Cubamyces sp. BRFM 1775]